MALPSSSDWASLPINLLDSILDYLSLMEDYFTFSEVCIRWQYAVREKLQHLRSNHKRHCRLHQQVPLLMATTAHNPRDSRRRCLYDVMKGKSLWEVQLGPGRWLYEGSSHGWLILLDNDYKVTLLNPFSGKLIHLPPIQDPVFVEHQGSRYKCPNPVNPRSGELSTDPDVNRGEFVLMMTCRFTRNLPVFKLGEEDLTLPAAVASIKSGEEDWSYIKELRDVEDIVYSNGVFYVLDGWGALFSCDVSNDFKVRRITSSDNQRVVFRSYLVESPEGDLLRVVRRKKKMDFVIYKLTWYSKNPRWEEVMSLGDVALFLGDNHCYSF